MLQNSNIRAKWREIVVVCPKGTKSGIFLEDKVSKQYSSINFPPKSCNDLSVLIPDIYKILLHSLHISTPLPFKWLPAVL